MDVIANFSVQNVPPRRLFFASACPTLRYLEPDRNTIRPDRLAVGLPAPLRQGTRNAEQGGGWAVGGCSCSYPTLIDEWYPYLHISQGALSPSLSVLTSRTSEIRVTAKRAEQLVSLSVYEPPLLLCTHGEDREDREDCDGVAKGREPAPRPPKTRAADSLWWQTMEFL